MSPLPQGQTLSTYIVCKDEADHIEACLRSVGFSDQIVVVVDSGSTDGTLEIVARLRNEGLPIELYEREWPGYAAQKQFALDRCTGDWCLNLDGDETVAEDFADQLSTLLPKFVSADVAGVRLRRRIALYGYGLPPRLVGPYPLLRLVRRGRARYDQSVLVHERIELTGRQITELRLTVHDHRALPVTGQLRKEARYADLKARQLAGAGKTWSLFKLLLNPPYAFLRAFVLRRYFLAGQAGFVRAVTIGAYTFMTEARLREYCLVRPETDGNTTYEPTPKQSGRKSV